MQLQNWEQHWSVPLWNVNLLLPLVPVQLNCNKIKSHFSRRVKFYTLSVLKTQICFSAFDVFENNLSTTGVSPMRNIQCMQKMTLSWPKPSRNTQKHIYMPHTSNIYQLRWFTLCCTPHPPTSGVKTFHPISVTRLPQTTHKLQPFQCPSRAYFRYFQGKVSYLL